MPDESFIPKSNKPKIGGLGRQAQKLQALREKAEGKSAKHGGTDTAGSKAKPLAGAKKVPFQRKAV